MSGQDNGQHDPSNESNSDQPNGQSKQRRAQSGEANDRTAREPLSAEVLEAQAERLVLNACLDEILGDVTPPDLAPQILQRLEAAQTAASQALKNGATTNGRNGKSPSPQPSGQQTSPQQNGRSAVDRALNGNAANRELEKSSASKLNANNGSSSNTDAASSGASHRRAPTEAASPSRRSWLITIVTCSACVLLAFVTYLNWQTLFEDEPHAENSSDGRVGQPQQQAGDNQRQPNNQLASGGPSNNSSDELANDEPGAGDANLADNGSSTPADRDRNAAAIANADTTNTRPARSISEVIASIDSALEVRWDEEGVTPSAWATDAEWCRRVYLDVLGRIPTVEESVAYVTSDQLSKKETLVDSLLFGDEYANELADHWANIWTNVLIGREGGTRPNDIASREGLHQYLTSAIRQHRPYDEMVTDLLTATGANRPQAPGFNGAVNFLLDNIDHDATSATAKTAQIFLARQIQCAQCHNHPFYEQPQKQFWELNAFFRQARVARGRGPNANRPNAVVRLVDRDFRGEGNRENLNEAEIYFERGNGLLEVAFPKFLDGTSIDPSGSLGVVNRRQELAKMIVNSPWMSEAIINRMWGYFLGAGFSRPLDDLGDHQSVSHPGLLQDLAGEFRTQGYDLRRLMQWIVLSKPYALSSELASAQQSVDQPFAAGGPLFSRFYARQLSPEAVYDSLLVAAGKHGRGNARDAERDRRFWLGQFTIELQNDENREVDLFDGAIPQTLEMWNGELTSQALSLKDQGLLASIVGSEMSDNDKIKHLFLSALSREPTNAEMRLVRGMVREAGKDGLPRVLQDVYWSLLNSSEFILQH